MKVGKAIGRREFLKLASTSLLAFPYGMLSSGNGVDNNLAISWENIPRSLRNIIRRVPKLDINQDGYLYYWDENAQTYSQAQIAQTQWNQERNNSFERLFPDKTWGIVLHWFGASFQGEDSLASYMRGFDGLRQVGNYQTRTSAHFLVGGLTPNNPESSLGIYQTQIPGPDGTPLVASHISNLDYQAHEEKQQYFVRAFYELGYKDHSIKSILTDLFDGRRLDPNYRTIAVEMAGANFDQDGNEPVEQEIANVLGLVIALMLRYEITALNILGHHEIELRKSDPGKQFMGLIRFLLGISALYSGDLRLKDLVFGAFTSGGVDPWSGILRYFKFIRDYQVIVDYPDQVYKWEGKVNYWNFYQNLTTHQWLKNNYLPPFNHFSNPINGKAALKKDTFLSPPEHEGVDLFLAKNTNIYNPEKKIQIVLPAPGECLQIIYEAWNGYTLYFKHIQKNGAAIVSMFANLVNIASLKEGMIYEAGHSIGTISAGGVLGEGYLHLAIAYSATWETILRYKGKNPLNVTSDWIKRRYIDPYYYWMCFYMVDSPGSSAE